MGHLISDSLSRQAATADSLQSDIGVTPLAKVLEVNDGMQLLAVPERSDQPASIDSTSE